MMVIYVIFVLPLSGSGDMDSLPKVREDICFIQNLSFLLYCSLYLCRLSSKHFSVSSVLLIFVQNSPGNLSMSNQPGTPREDGEMGGNFLNPFQNESVSQLSSTAWVHFY